MDDDLVRRLVLTGVDRTRASALVALMSLGSAGPAEVARAAQIPRSTAYGVLDALVRDGLATATRSGRCRRFSANGPQALLELPRRQEQRLRELMPDLLQLAAATVDRPRISIHEGAEGIRRVNEELLTTREGEYRYIAGATDIVASLGEAYLRDWVRRRVALKIRCRSIRVRSRELDLPVLGHGTRWLREVRYIDRLPTGGLAQIYVFDRRVGVISTRAEGWGMLIDSPETAAVFDLMWRTLWERATPA